MKKVFMSLVILLIAAMSSFAMDIVAYNSADYDIIVQAVDPYDNSIVIDETIIYSHTAMGYTIKGYGTVDVIIGFGSRNNAMLFKGVNKNYIIYVDNTKGNNHLFDWR